MTWCEGSLAKHREAGGAVPCGAVVSNPACVFGLIRQLDSPRLQKEHHVSYLPDHRAVRQFQVIFWIPVTATWQIGQTAALVLLVHSSFIAA